MSVGLSGNLGDFGIADVFQLIGQQRKTGMLELRNEDKRIQLLFASGLVVSASPAVSRAGDLDPLGDRMVRCGMLTRERAFEASVACRASAQTLSGLVVERGWLDASAVREAEALVTRDTIFDVLRWQKGSFDFRAQEVSQERRPSELLGAEQILMDGLRMVDEWQSFSPTISEDAVYARGESFEKFLEGQPAMAASERERAERVYALVDGRLDARRVIDLARLGTFDGIRCLAELKRGGAIRATRRGEGYSGLASLRANADQGRARAGQAFATVVPLLALAAVVWWTTSSSAGANVGLEGPVLRSSLAGLSSDYATRALKHAAEAYRLEHGRWPADLEALVRAGRPGDDALATPRTRPYYSLHRELGPVLLEPEHR